MGGVSEQHGVRLAPVLDRLTVAQHPHAPGLNALQHAQHFRPLPLEMIPQLRGITLRIPALDVTIRVEDCDEVVEFAASQRVVHEMGARPGPEYDVRAPQVLRHVIPLQYGAVGDVPGHTWLAVPDDTLADL